MHTIRRHEARPEPVAGLVLEAMDMAHRSAEAEVRPGDAARRYAEYFAREADVVMCDVTLRLEDEE